MNPVEVQGGAGAATAPALCFRGVTYRYRPEASPVVDGLHLDVGRGELVALIGGNGSGKTTLARLANGLLLPQRGEVLVDGLSTADSARLWDIRARVGLLFQDPEDQIVATTVEDEVAFGLENLGVPLEEMRAKVTAALQVVGLESERDTPPHLLSGGQKQRLALAGVLVLRPSVLVLDEPTSMLDAAGREDVLAHMRCLAQEGVAIVLITQRMDEVLDADRLVAIGGGRLVYDGAPNHFFRSGRYRALPVGRPSVLALAESLGLTGTTPAAADPDGRDSVLRRPPGSALVGREPGRPAPCPLTEDELLTAIAGPAPEPIRPGGADGEGG